MSIDVELTKSCLADALRECRFDAAADIVLTSAEIIARAVLAERDAEIERLREPEPVGDVPEWCRKAAISWTTEPMRRQSSEVQAKRLAGDAVSALALLIHEWSQSEIARQARRQVEDIKDSARDRNPGSRTIADFMTVWNDQQCKEIADLKAKLADAEANCERLSASAAESQQKLAEVRWPENSRWFFATDANGDTRAVVDAARFSLERKARVAAEAALAAERADHERTRAAHNWCNERRHSYGELLLRYLAGVGWRIDYRGKIHDGKTYADAVRAAYDAEHPAEAKLHHVATVEADNDKRI